MKRSLFYVLLTFVLWVGGFSEELQEAVIIHWNDMHSANIPYMPMYGNPDGIYVGGYSNLAGYIDSLKLVYTDVITLNAGDDFQGSPISPITNGMSQICILNVVKPTVFTLGNHEFDYGVENLKNAIEASKFTIVSSNVYDSTESSLLVEPYTIIRSGRLRIAVIGIILESLESQVMLENIESMGILDPKSEVEKYVDKLKRRTDLIVVLSHCGFESDSVLACQLSEVDVIIGGHSHTVLRQPVVVNNILICQAGSHGRYVGLLRAVIDSVKKRINSYRYELIETELGKVKQS